MEEDQLYVDGVASSSVSWEMLRVAMFELVASSVVFVRVQEHFHFPICYCYYLKVKYTLKLNTLLEQLKRMSHIGYDYWLS